MAKYLDSNGLSHFMTLIKTALNGKADTTAIPAPYESTPEMDSGNGSAGSSNLYSRGNHVHPTDTSRQETLVSGTNIKTVGSQSLLGSGNLTPANIGAAASSHSHGNITSGGDITATPPTVANGDKIIINDESESKVTNGPSFGTSTTTYLRNDGTWGTPVGTANQNAFSNVKVGSTTIAADTTTDTLEVVAGSNITLTPDATNDKLTIAATDTTYSDFTGATSSAAGAHGLVPAPASGEQNDILFGDGDWDKLHMAAAASQDGNANPIIGLTIRKHDSTGAALATAQFDAATTSTIGLMTAADKTKLNGIATGAEVNQNAFSNVKVGSTTVAADGKTDTLELVAGSNVTLTPDATNDKVTIAASNNKVAQMQETSNSSFDILFKNSTGHSEETNPVKFDPLNDFKYNPSTGILYVNKINNYTLGAACAKAIGTVTDGSTGLVTGDAVYDAIQDAVSSALSYKGTVDAESDLLNVALSNGWMYIVTMPNAQTSSIVIGGHTVEEGDTIIVKTAGTYTSGSALGAAIDVIQSDIDALTTTEINSLWAAA